MKICPFCKAQIEDNARFCLYCMRPLVEKEFIPPQKQKKLWRLFCVAGVLAVAVIAAILLLSGKKPAQPQAPSAATALPTVATTVPAEIPTADPTQEPTAASAESTVASDADSMDPVATESAGISAEATLAPTGTLATGPMGTVGKPMITPTTASVSHSIVIRPTTAHTSGSATKATTATAGPTRGSIPQSTEKPVESISTESTVISATAGGSQSTRPRPSVVKPVRKPTTTVSVATEGTQKPGTTATKPAAAATKATTAPTYKPTTGSTSAPTVMPVTKPTSVAATTNQPTSGATTAPTYKPTTVPTTAPTSAPNTKPVTQTTTAPTTTPTEPPATEPVDVDSLPSKWWEDPDTYHDYRYRQAVQADVLGLDYQVTANDIVVTKIELWEGGYLQIPSYIEGKRVIALSSAIFVEGAPEHLELPATLLALHSGVFIERPVLSPRVYVNGEVLAVGDETEPWREIYTSKTCVNQHGEKFSSYSRWKEWNG